MSSYLHSKHLVFVSVVQQLQAVVWVKLRAVRLQSGWLKLWKITINLKFWNAFVETLKFLQMLSHSINKLC